MIFRFIKYLLLPVSLIFSSIVYLRNKFYDWGCYHTYRVNAPVISIGNIQIGGTGKTPFAEFLARKLLVWGKKPAILTRGYRRKITAPVIINEKNRDLASVKQIGDEPLLLADNLPTITIGIDSDRYQMAERIIKIQPDTIFILDDGFQHRRMRRNLDVVLLDVSRWTPMPFLFPIYPFRDLKSSLSRANIIILTRTEIDLQKTKALKSYLIDKYAVPVFTAEIKPDILKNIVTGETLYFEDLEDKYIGAFCGIANTKQFYDMLEKKGCSIGWRKSYADHHRYSAQDIQEIAANIRKIAVEVVVTTQKDAVKIRDKMPKGITNIYFLKLSIGLEEEKKFDKRIQNLFHKTAQ